MEILRRKKNLGFHQTTLPKKSGVRIKDIPLLPKKEKREKGVQFQDLRVLFPEIKLIKATSVGVWGKRGHSGTPIGHALS